MMCQKLYGLLLMPLIFVYVGTQLQLNLLLNPALVLVIVIITILAALIKGTIAMLALRAQGYSKVEQKLSLSLFSAKGPILINVSLILSPLFIAVGLDDLLQYMYILAAISILLTTPYSIISSNKLIEKLDNAV